MISYMTPFTNTGIDSQPGFLVDDRVSRDNYTPGQTGATGHSDVVGHVNMRTLFPKSSTRELSRRRRPEVRNKLSVNSKFDEALLKYLPEFLHGLAAGLTKLNSH